MNVLVTGATGFIGRHLIERLTHGEGRIRALVLPEEDTSALEPFGIEIVRGDVRDYQSVERAAANCQLIFHLAAKTEASRAPRKALEEVNIQGTANVARAALHVGAGRLVFCSSGALYGRDIKNRSINEATIPTPDSTYGESKFLAERVLLSHHQRDGLPVVLARTSAVFGPGAVSWLNLFQTIASGRFRLIGAGQNHHHVADVVDIVEGLALCGSVKGIEGRTYILAGSESVGLRDLILMIGKKVGVTRLPRNLPAGPFCLYEIASRYVYSWAGCRLPRADRIDLYLGDRAFDLSVSRQELGYVPKVSTKEAVHRTAEWFKAQGYIQSHFN
jgi:nucleoside-diphosphate-sugar epimerase